MSDGEHVRALVRAALVSLEASRQRIDDLNVYPVPDGDTGTNLTLTVRAVAEALDRSSAPDRPTLAREITRAALMGARGNSGVILSQIVRGAAESLGEPGPIGAAAVAVALRRASDAAYRAVRRPVEGTMLTAIRELAEEAEEQAGAGASLEALFAAIVRRGDDAVARTPELLPVLREAGVVDAGAAGLVKIVRGIAAEIAGAPPAPHAELAAPLSLEAIHREESRCRYCTGFAVQGGSLDAAELERELEPLGDSLLVVGDASALKVHVHTDDPGAALSVGVRHGAVEAVEIADMHRQTVRREQRLLRAVSPAVRPGYRSAVVAVAAGEGNRRLFSGLGAAELVEGGQTMNPSVADILHAVEATGASEVVILPNNGNVILAAEQAARLAAARARVVPTGSIPAGLAALVAFNPKLGADENAEAMAEAAAQVATGEVTVASRDSLVDGVAVRQGAYVGLVDGVAVASGPGFDEVARAVLERLLARPRDLVTLLSGVGAPPLDPVVSFLRESYPKVEVEVETGGQPHYPLLVSAE